MKKLFITVLFATATLAVQATVRTVNNAGGAQFTDIEAAVLASTAGDTIYICGSSTSYNGATTRKNNIVFIGAGFNPQKQNPVKTIANTSFGNFNVGNNNILIGLVFQGPISYLDGCTGLTLDRCYGQNAITGSGGSNILTNLTVSHCIWKENILSFNKVINGLITNTIFYTSLNGASVFANLQAPGYMLIDRCTFVSITGAANNVFVNAPTGGGFTFSNNVLFNFNLNNMLSCTYNNNVGPATLPGGTNIVNTVWPFNQTQASVTGAVYNFGWAFTILTTSVAFNAAADGTDAGVYGGVAPFNWDGEPAIPQIDVMTTTGNQFSSGGTMQINFQSSVQD